jgi:hypothetical protein
MPDAPLISTGDQRMLSCRGVLRRDPSLGRCASQAIYAPIQRPRRWSVPAELLDAFGGGRRWLFVPGFDEDTGVQGSTFVCADFVPIVK